MLKEVFNLDKAASKFWT